MLSLCVWTAVLSAALLLPAWVIAYSARRAGSPRGRFRVGLGVQLLIGVVNAAVIAAAAALAAQADDITSLVVDLGLSVLNLLAAFVLMRWAFQLSIRRTFVPFGAFFVLNVILAVAVVGVIRPFVCQTYRLPSISMAPTIEPGNRFSVNKLAKPRRWDLVVYYNYNEDQGGILYCKRLIGLPGERLRFEGGSLYVNDQAVIPPPVLAGRLRATLPNLPPSMFLYREGETINLGPTDYFVVGDNLDKSNDSRLEGPTDADAMAGVIDLIYWPAQKAAVLR